MPSVMYTECHKLGFYAECYYAECRYTECRGAFAIANHSYHSLIFVAKARSYKVKPLFRLHSTGRILEMPANIRLGWKLMEVINALAYGSTEFITSVKSFIVLDLGSIRFKSTFFETAFKVLNKKNITIF